MKFTKMQGTGNDFVLVDARAQERNWRDTAIAVCDRHFGVGADGLLLVLPSLRCDVRMRMFNPDGTEAEMCGNGIRCVAKYAVEAGLCPPTAAAVMVETLAGDLRCEVQRVSGQVERVRVAMGSPRFQPGEIPVTTEGSGPLRDLQLSTEHFLGTVTCVSMGNPHAVHFTRDLVATVPLEIIGPEVEHHALFPRRVNFEIVNVLGPGDVEARVWERGAGLTLACGTGACAVGVAAHLAGISDRVTNVRLPRWRVGDRVGRLG